MITEVEPQQSEFISCNYCNPSPQIQVIRITNISNWYFERVVFPQQNLVFTAPKEAQLEIHTSELATAIQSDCIPCRQLCVKSA